MGDVATDPKPAEDIRFLRASVANQCNLSCVYCPKSSGMENFTPADLAGHRLPLAAYLADLEHLARDRVIRGVSFTGGEPTLNPDLPVIVEHARKLFDRVEMTTNGRMLPRMIERLAPNLDVMKVSLDAVDPDLAGQIMRGHLDDRQIALDAIRMGLAAGVTIGINIVAMRRNFDQIHQVIRLAQQLRRETGGALYVSVLDLYYTDETRELWLDEFIPLDGTAEELREKLGDGQRQDRGGCEIGWFEADGVQIRLKDSYSSTYRGERCTSCSAYCQEGFYGLKLSVEGWVTPCPSGRADLGVHLPAGIGVEEARERLRPLLDELLSTRRVNDSFATFLDRRDLLGAGSRTRLPILPSARHG